MACYHPISAYRKLGYWDDDGVFVKGAVSLKENGGSEIKLPCGKCIGCRLRRQQVWALRCMHEAQICKVNSFVTLTYDDAHYKPSLEYRDFQLFLKRLRKACALPVRFFVAGEYGEQKDRPHWHALLFGAAFQNDGKVGKNIYRSKDLERLWPFGFSSVGEVNHTTATYVAKYVVEGKSPSYDPDYYKRVDLLTGEIIDVTPEFGRMSLRPGIGASWFDRYWTDVYAARDGVVVKGKTVKAPRYYDKRLDKFNPLVLADKEFDRFVRAEAHKEDGTPERLAVRELVDKGRLEFYKNRKL